MIHSRETVLRETVARRSSVLAVMSVLALAGCAAATPVQPWAFGEPSAAPTVTPRAVDPEIAAFSASDAVAGEVVSEVVARAVNRDLKDGLRGYELPDGTFVLVKQNEPLPDAVRADAEARAAAIPVVTGTSVDDQRQSYENGRGLSDTLTFETGKRVVVVTYSIVAFLDGRIRLAWRAAEAPLNSQGVYPASTNRDAVVAEAQALINAQPNPAEWEIVVQPR